VDRAAMGAEELARSRQAVRQYQRRASRYLLPRIGRMALPFYNPCKQRAPRGLENFLQRVEQQFLA